MTQTRIKAQYTNVQSHYGKAMVLELEDRYELHSYDTHVATVERNSKHLTIIGLHSQTTMRHLKDFILQYTDYYIYNDDDIRKLYHSQGE